MKAIATQNAPAAIGPYSQAIEANGTVYVSGQLGIDPATGNFAEGGAVAQARQSLTNISNILKEAGLSMKNVVKVTVLLADINDLFVCNLDDGLKESSRLIRYTITREQRQAFYTEAVRRQSLDNTSTPEATTSYNALLSPEESV